MSKEKRIAKMKQQLEKIKLERELEEAKIKLRKLKKSTSKPKVVNNLIENISDSGTDISKGSINRIENVVSGRRSMALAGVRNPISDSEEMWVKSWWENRKSMDPNFDIDNWFVSSTNMDLKERNRQIDDFWAGRNTQNTDNFWTGPSMWSK